MGAEPAGPGLLATVRLALWAGAGGADRWCDGVPGDPRVCFSAARLELCRTDSQHPAAGVHLYLLFFISGQLLPLLISRTGLPEATPETRVLAWLFGPVELLPNFLSGLICLALLEGAYVTEIVGPVSRRCPSRTVGGGAGAGAACRSGDGRGGVAAGGAEDGPGAGWQFIALIKDSSLISLISIQN